MVLLGGVMGLIGCNHEQTNAATENINQKDTTMEVINNVESRTNIGAKLFVTPQPALMIATYDAEGNPDVMMAAWGGQCDVNQVCFKLSHHKTTDNLRLNKAFTLSYATVNDVVQSDYFGIVSGNDVKDKVAVAGFTCTKSPNVNAPIIKEYALTMECRVVRMDELDNGGAFVVGEVVNASADESILTEGKIDLSKLKPIVFDAANMSYRTVGEEVGKAWGSGKELIK